MIESTAGEENSFRCLVADDSALARRNISSIVKKLGGSIAGEASDGLEAVSIYARLRPDLVVLDITMPRLDGIEALRRIMDQDRNANVVIVSSIGHKEMIWKAICLGAKNFIMKPYKWDHASMIIRDVVRSRLGDHP